MPEQKGRRRPQIPRYDYLCDNCGKTVEIVHGAYDESEVKCPKCGKAMEKQICTGVTGIINF